MDQTKFSTGISLKDIQITDLFFKQNMETVRKEVITYQWEALNDNIEGASPSFCMRNFKVAAKLGEKRRLDSSEIPTYTTDIFNLVPESMDNLEERFYGFVFQDTDFYKWIEAVGYSLSQHPDVKLEQLADEAIDIVCAAQYEDGYLDTFYIINDPSKRFTNLRDHHELYCLGHLIEGAVAYYEATGKNKLLNAAIRFADYVISRFGLEEGKCKGYPGHEIAEMALVRLYDVTGERRYLELAKFFVDERGKRPYYFSLERGEESGEKEGYHYHQAHKPVREQDEAVGHAVRAVYLYSGMADVAKYTEDEGLFAACERLWNNIEQKKMYINGGIGASPEGEAFSYNYNLPNDKMYNETCASIGLIFFARRMLEITPKSYYADVMERALYNGVLSGMSLDGKSFFYVNPLEVEPEGCKEDAQRKQVALPRQKWFGCACCPPNIARLVSSIASYAYSENETTLFMHLYLGGKMKKKFAGQDVSINVESEYPWKNAVSIMMETERPVSFTMAIRMPGWSKESKVLINGAGAEYEIIDGYAYLNREWQNGDQITLGFDMEPVFYQTNTNVRSNIGKAVLMRGPVVYCLEEKDNGKNLHLVEVDVQAPVNIVPGAEELGSIAALEASGRRIKESVEEGLYKSFTGYEYEDAVLKYIPYYVWCNRGVGEMQVYTGWYREN